LNVRYRSVRDEYLGAYSCHFESTHTYKHGSAATDGQTQAGPPAENQHPAGARARPCDRRRLDGRARQSATAENCQSPRSAADLRDGPGGQDTPFGFRDLARNVGRWQAGGEADRISSHGGEPRDHCRAGRKGPGDDAHMARSRGQRVPRSAPHSAVAGSDVRTPPGKGARPLRHRGGPAARNPGISAQSASSPFASHRHRRAECRRVDADGAAVWPRGLCHRHPETRDPRVRMGADCNVLAASAWCGGHRERCGRVVVKAPKASVVGDDCASDANGCARSKAFRRDERGGE